MPLDPLETTAKSMPDTKNIGDGLDPISQAGLPNTLLCAMQREQESLQETRIWEDSSEYRSVVQFMQQLTSARKQIFSMRQQQLCINFCGVLFRMNKLQSYAAVLGYLLNQTSISVAEWRQFFNFFCDEESETATFDSLLNVSLGFLSIKVLVATAGAALDLERVQKGVLTITKKRNDDPLARTQKLWANMSVTCFVQQLKYNPIEVARCINIQRIFLQENFLDCSVYPDALVHARIFYQLCEKIREISSFYNLLCDLYATDLFVTEEESVRDNISLLLRGLFKLWQTGPDVFVEMLIVLEKMKNTPVWTVVDIQHWIRLVDIEVKYKNFHNINLLSFCDILNVMREARVLTSENFAMACRASGHFSSVWSAYELLLREKMIKPEGITHLLAVPSTHLQSVSHSVLILGNFQFEMCDLNWKNICMLNDFFQRVLASFRRAMSIKPEYCVVLQNWVKAFLVIFSSELPENVCLNVCLFLLSLSRAKKYPQNLCDISFEITQVGIDFFKDQVHDPSERKRYYHFLKKMFSAERRLLDKQTASALVPYARIWAKVMVHEKRDTEFCKRIAIAVAHEKYLGPAFFAFCFEVNAQNIPSCGLRWLEELDVCLQPVAQNPCWKSWLLGDLSVHGADLQSVEQQIIAIEGKNFAEILKQNMRHAGKIVKMMQEIYPNALDSVGTWRGLTSLQYGQFLQFVRRQMQQELQESHDPQWHLFFEMRMSVYCCLVFLSLSRSISDSEWQNLELYKNDGRRLKAMAERLCSEMLGVPIVFGGQNDSQQQPLPARTELFQASRGQKRLRGGACRQELRPPFFHSL